MLAVCAAHERSRRAGQPGKTHKSKSRCQQIDYKACVSSYVAADMMRHGAPARKSVAREA